MILTRSESFRERLFCLEVRVVLAPKQSDLRGRSGRSHQPKSSQSQNFSSCPCQAIQTTWPTRLTVCCANGWPQPAQCSRLLACKSAKKSFEFFSPVRDITPDVGVTPTRAASFRRATVLSFFLGDGSETLGGWGRMVLPFVVTAAEPMAAARCRIRRVRARRDTFICGQRRPDEEA